MHPPHASHKSAGPVWRRREGSQITRGIVLAGCWRIWFWGRGFMVLWVWGLVTLVEGIYSARSELREAGEAERLRLAVDLVLWVRGVVAFVEGLYWAQSDVREAGEVE